MGEGGTPRAGVSNKPVIVLPRRLIDSLEEAFVLNAVSRFDAYRHRKRARFLPQWGRSALYAAGTVVLFLFAFQFFLRYQYVSANGRVWRVDRLTQQTCRMEGAECVDPSQPKFSTSTSTSTSTSLSVDLKPPKPKKH